MSIYASSFPAYMAEVKAISRERNTSKKNLQFYHGSKDPPFASNGAYSGGGFETTAKSDFPAYAADAHAKRARGTAQPKNGHDFAETTEFYGITTSRSEFAPKPIQYNRVHRPVSSFESRPFTPGHFQTISRSTFDKKTVSGDAPSLLSKEEFLRKKRDIMRSNAEQLFGIDAASASYAHIHSMYRNDFNKATSGERIVHAKAPKGSFEPTPTDPSHFVSLNRQAFSRRPNAGITAPAKPPPATLNLFDAQGGGDFSHNLFGSKPKTPRPPLTPLSARSSSQYQQRPPTGSVRPPTGVRPMTGSSRPRTGRSSSSIVVEPLEDDDNLVEFEETGHHQQHVDVLEL